MGGLLPPWGNEPGFQTLFPTPQGCIPASPLLQLIPPCPHPCAAVRHGVRLAESRGGCSGPLWVLARGSPQHRHFQAEQVRRCSWIRGGRLKSVLPKLSHQPGMREGSGAAPDVQDGNPHPPPTSRRPEDSGGAAAIPHRHSPSPSPSASAVAAPHSPGAEPWQIAPALQHQRRVEPAVAETRRGEEAIRIRSSFTGAAASRLGVPNGRCSSGTPNPPCTSAWVFSPLLTAQNTFC